MRDRSSLAELAWPLERLAEAITLVAELGRMQTRAITVPAPPPFPALSDDTSLARWVEAVSAWLGLDAEPVDAAYGEARAMLGMLGPAVLRVPGSMAFWAVVRSAKSEVILLSPDRTLRRVPIEALRASLCRHLEAPIETGVEAWLAGLRTPPRQRRRAVEAIACERLGAERVGGAWILRLPPGASFWAQLSAERVPRRLAALVATHFASSLLGIAGWWLLGRGALSGRLEWSWIVAWLLVLLSTVPLRLLSLWSQATLSVCVGRLLRRRLLAGALRLDPDAIRHEGSGRLLGRAMEASAVESLALGAGMSAVMSIIDLVVVVAVLSAGRGGVPHAALLLVWAVVTAASCWGAWRSRRRWTETRRALTNELVEQMVGHRTRLAQQRPESWHEGEDEALERYHGLSRDMDVTGVRLQALPQLWVVVALAGLVPAFVAGGSEGLFAVALGGVLLGAEALRTLSSGLMEVALAAISWREVRPLFEAAARAEVQPSPVMAVTPPHPAAIDRGAPILDASDLSFAYPGRPEPVLKGASLRIERGDRLLLEGPSGGGKSTFASLLAGLRAPSSGLLLLDGLDYATVGARGWRRRVAAAPQYHENHILTETLAFNLLMGRAWPPTDQDLEDAEGVCTELGLDELLTRMPAGLMQMVGETGWRLSHGERSRVFMARAMLQLGCGGEASSSLVVLDESFAALDAKTLERCMRCVLRRAPSVLVVAHP